MATNVTLDLTAYDIVPLEQGPFYCTDGQADQPGAFILDLVVDDDFDLASLQLGQGTIPFLAPDPMTEIIITGVVEIEGEPPPGRKNIEVSLSLPPPDGDKTLVFVGIDCVENEATPSEPIVVTLDRTAPVVDVHILSDDGGKLSIKRNHRVLKFTIVMDHDAVAVQVRCHTNATWDTAPTVNLGVPEFVDPEDGSTVVISTGGLNRSVYGVYDGVNGFIGDPSSMSAYMTVNPNTEYLFWVDMRDVVATGFVDHNTTGCGTRFILGAFVHDPVGHVNPGNPL
jgi:hypothetical protein